MQLQVRPCVRYTCDQWHRVKITSANDSHVIKSTVLHFILKKVEKPRPAGWKCCSWGNGSQKVEDKMRPAIWMDRFSVQDVLKMLAYVNQKDVFLSLIMAFSRIPSCMHHLEDERYCDSSWGSVIWFYMDSSKTDFICMNYSGVISWMGDDSILDAVSLFKALLWKSFGPTFIT